MFRACASFCPRSASPLLSWYCSSCVFHSLLIVSSSSRPQFPIRLWFPPVYISALVRFSRREFLVPRSSLVRLLFVVVLCWSCVSRRLTSRRLFVWSSPQLPVPLCNVCYYSLVVGCVFWVCVICLVAYQWSSLPAGVTYQRGSLPAG